MSGDLKPAPQSLRESTKVLKGGLKILLDSQTASLPFPDPRARGVSARALPRGNSPGRRSPFALRGIRCNSRVGRRRSGAGRRPAEEPAASATERRPPGQRTPAASPAAWARLPPSPDSLARAARRVRRVVARAYTQRRRGVGAWRAHALSRKRRSSCSGPVRHPVPRVVLWGGLPPRHSGAVCHPELGITGSSHPFKPPQDLMPLRTISCASAALTARAGTCAVHCGRRASGGLTTSKFRQV